jgi:hypothetical protein
MYPKAIQDVLAGAVVKRLEGWRVRGPPDAAAEGRCEAVRLTVAPAATPPLRGSAPARSA